MINYHERFFPFSINILSKSEDPSILHSLKEYIDRKIENSPDLLKIEKLLENYPPGSQISAQVQSIQKYGLFVEFGLEGNGLIHLSEFKGLSSEYIDCFEVGDWVEVEIIEYSKKHNRFTLRLIDYS